MAAQSSWPDLPQDILESIFGFAKDPIDIVRCGAVCKSWLPTALQVFRKFFPLCLIQYGKGMAETRVVFNILTKETRKIYLPEATQNWIIGSCNSWLFMVDFIRFPDRLKLLNIFSKSQIDLPIPISSSAKLSPVDYFRDKLYASISESNHRKSLVTCNYQLEIEAMVSIPEIFQSYYTHPFFIKSHNDDLWLVGCSINGSLYPDGAFFKIFEFDVCIKEFREVNDLGGCSLFLCFNDNHVLAKARNSETWFKANCIYHFRFWERKYCVFDLETRILEILPCQIFTKSEYKRTLWFNLDV
ncbi:uncharacterized protein LOC111276328 [Durio zibethinus]|uniref:Uncharacterized protein LOC111276328 n=1 Tax=Durio zibethinus TaxID=66656 RepID=A0A6P5WQ17_DURZI|nr:uncharacterized protein LOC111276328 [Durio zibethinus]